MEKNIYKIMYIQKSIFHYYYKKRNVTRLEVFGAVRYLGIKLFGVTGCWKKQIDGMDKKYNLTCPLTSLRGSIEPFFVQMVETTIACTYARFAVITVHISYILRVFTHFCLGKRKTYHHVNIIWPWKAQDLKDGEINNL